MFIHAGSSSDGRPDPPVPDAREGRDEGVAPLGPPVATAARLGWLLAEAYRAVQTASDPAREEAVDEHRLLSRRLVPSAVVDRTRHAVINGLVEQLSQRFAPPGLPGVANLGAGGPVTARQVLDIDSVVRSWLLLSTEPAAHDAYLVGRALSDLGQDGEAADPAPLLATVRSLGPALGDGIADSLVDSIRTWSQVDAEPTGRQERAVRRQWQELLFGVASVSEVDERDLVAEVASEVRWVFVLGVIALVALLGLGAWGVVYALAGDGSVWQRVGAGLIGAGTAVAAVLGGLRRALMAMWEGFLRRHLTTLRIRSSYELRLQRVLASDESTLDDLPQ